MIIGIGTDMVDVGRIKKALNDYDSRFKDRVFTSKEQAYAQKKPNPVAAYAKRFAAKEAFAKALGVGLQGLGAPHSDGLAFLDIEVVNDKYGKPEIVIAKAIFEKLQARLHDKNKAAQIKIHLSLSDELPFVLAYVIIEKIS